VVVNTCWDKYRQRSNTRGKEIEEMVDKEYTARKSFLIWLDDYITQLGRDEKEVRLAIHKEFWLHKSPAWSSNSKKIRSSLRWIKKWILRLDEWILPISIQYRFWL